MLPANGGRKSTSPMGRASKRKSLLLKTTAETQRRPHEKCTKREETLSSTAEPIKGKANEGE